MSEKLFKSSIEATRGLRISVPIRCAIRVKQITEHLDVYVLWSVRKLMKKVAFVTESR